MNPRIKPLFENPSNPIRPSILEAVQSIVESMMPLPFWETFNCLSQPREIAPFLYRFSKHLPLFQTISPTTVDSPLFFNYLGQSEYTNGAARYVVDMLNRWLVPGKDLESVGSLSLHFHFDKAPSQKFYLRQEILLIQDPSDLESIRQNLEPLIQEMKLNLMAVYHARYISSLKSISVEQKNFIIKKNFSSLFNYSIEDTDISLHDQMQSFLTKLSEDEKIKEVNKNIVHLSKSRPKIFPREVFQEMGEFKSILSAKFIAQRSCRHISRLIAYHYLFKKVLQDQIGENPEPRPFSIKMFHARLSDEKPILGILFGIGLRKETERFEKKQLMKAIRSSISEAQFISDSYIADRKDPKIHFYYLEIARPHDPAAGIGLLKERLPFELDQQVERVLHPVFMPRNEEELLRNIVELSRQLKYARDLPQLIIHYEKQTDFELFFTVTAVRLLTPRTRPIREILQNSSIQFDLEDIRIIGQFKQKYEKEAIILRARLAKAPFFRQDFSLDLLRARGQVVSELNRLLGEFRDFNGGMILKQEEALTLLRKSIQTIDKDLEFLLEDYFHSLKPGIMKTVHEPSVLKEHFSMLVDLLKKGSAEHSPQFKMERKEPFILAFIQSDSPTLRQRLLEAFMEMKILSHQLTSCSLHMENKPILGFIFRFDHPQKAERFETAIHKNLYLS